MNNMSQNISELNITSQKIWRSLASSRHVVRLRLTAFIGPILDEEFVLFRKMCTYSIVARETTKNDKRRPRLLSSLCETIGDENTQATHIEVLFSQASAVRTGQFHAQRQKYVWPVM